MSKQTYNMLIAPDFSPERFAGWHMLNTVLQKRSDINLHLQTPASYAEQKELVANGNVHLIYANPFDAAALVREQGYRAIVRPVDKSDEMVIASLAKGDVQSLEDIKAGTKVAMADNRDVKLIGLRLLESVDITEDDLQWEITETYQAAAKQVIQGNAQVGFFMAEVFHTLSKLTKMQMSVLIESDLADISHVLLVKDDFDFLDVLTSVLLSLNEDQDGQVVLNELGMPKGFEAMSEEDAEFMIDLMDTLLS